MPYKDRAQTREASRRYYHAHKEKEAERAKRYHAEHPDYRSRYYRANKDRQDAATKKWREENPERYRSLVREWERAHPERYAPKSSRHRALVASVFSLPIPVADLEAKRAYWGGLCWICRESSGDTWDHVKPLSRGGAHILSNLRPACVSCNSRKRDRWPFGVTA